MDGWKKDLDLRENHKYKRNNVKIKTQVETHNYDMILTYDINMILTNNRASLFRLD